jgi:hypothetical protein
MSRIEKAKGKEITTFIRVMSLIILVATGIPFIIAANLVGDYSQSTELAIATFLFGESISAAIAIAEGAIIRTLNYSD